MGRERSVRGRPTPPTLGTRGARDVSWPVVGDAEGSVLVADTSKRLISPGLGDPLRLQLLSLLPDQHVAAVHLPQQ